MYSEHLNNVHPGWVIGGWLVAIAVASAAFVVLVGMGVMRPGVPGEGLWVSVAVAAGFFAGGLFVGFRWTDAPILHAVAITLVSVLVWWLGNLLLPERLGGGEVELQPASLVLGLILLQFGAAAAGGWMGRRAVLRRGDGTEEDGATRAG